MENVTIIDPANDPRWDKFVESHPLGWIVHLSGWKQLLEKSFPHMKGHYLALVDSSDNSIKAGLPLFEVRSWLTGNRLVSIPFAQLSDPLITTNDDMEKLLEGAFNLSQKLNTSYVEIRTFNTPEPIQNSRLRGDELYKHHFLRLDEEPEKIKNNFHYKAVRYEINKAIKNKLILKIADSESELKNFQDLFMKTRKGLGVPYQPYYFLKSLWYIFYPLNMIKLLLAKHEEQVIAGILFIQFKGRFSAEFLAWDRKFSGMSPNNYLYWEGIKLAHKNGNKIFDFGITSPINKSLVAFKNRWGTQVMDLHRYYYSEDASKNFVESETSLKQKLIEGICKNSPELIYRLFGNFCFRHMG